MKKNYNCSGVGQHPSGMVLPGCISVMLLCISLFSFSQGDSWQQKPSLGLAATARSRGVSFSIGDKGYAGGGVLTSDLSGAAFIDFWEYDPATNVWTQKADLPGARSTATGFSIDNKGYIGNRDFWEYDPATNTWTRKADFRGAGTSGATGFSIGNKGYMGTGIDSLSQSTNDFWQFDPITNVWTRKANFGGAVRNAASGFSVGGKGYIGLGQGGMPFIPTYADFWEYDPQTDTWTQKADFGGGERWGATGFPVGNKGFLGIGNNNLFRSQNDFWEYDPATNTWVQKANFAGDARGQAIGFGIGSKGYIGTGYRNINDNIHGPTTDFWAYDTASNTWSKEADFGGGPRQDAVGFSIAGKGYVGTGIDGSPKKDFWEYDPATSQWKQKADFAGGDRRVAIGFGTGEKGYLGTGFVLSRFSFFKDLWQYDPATNAWTSSGGVPGDLPGRGGAFACRIGDKEYVGGGYYYADPISDFWEFDPATGAWTQKALPPDGVVTGLIFGIGNKGYTVGAIDWEYDPATNVWTKKANRGIEGIAYTFSTKTKGYALTRNNDLWEYDPANDAWAHRANFPGPARQGATAFTIGDHGYFGFGSTINGLKNDFWEYIPLSANSITTKVAPTSFCSGSTITVSFAATGTFEPGNIFTADLSDSSGGFSRPKIIGIDTSIISGSMNIVVPDSLSSGGAYRIRVVASRPAINGSDNGVNLVINPPPVARGKDLTVYLNERGIARLHPEEVDSASVAYCGALKSSLDDTIFNCKETGPNRVRLTVADGNGNKATDTVIITVLDTLKPLIRDAFARPHTLWPPNHRMRRVTIYYRADDNCCVASKSLSVTSNEPPIGNRPDWLILDDHHLLLRAEVNGRRQRERIYYITITVKDSSGNTAVKVVKVVVSRHDRDDHWSEREDDSANEDVVRKEAGTEANGFTVSAHPNPARQSFTLVFRSDDDQPIMIRVADAFGRLIEVRGNVAPNGTLQIGSNYRPGNYYVQVIQGEDRVTLHLVKLPN
ncbi:MAG TPA: hypothetical protein VL832_18525 [Puia sp.]|nr:hypothetical protein [Puia sp.]